MSQGGSQANRPRVPYGAFGAFVLLLAIESAVAHHDLDFTSLWRFEWRLSRQAARREAPGCQILAFGTSMTKFGFYPPVAEAESGRRIYNLACSAGRLPGSYYLLRRALEAGARPEAILLEVHPTYLDTPFRASLTAWPDLLDPAECLDLAWSARDASFFLSTCLARALPSLRARAEIRIAILALLRGEIGSTRKDTVPYERNLKKNRGAFVSRRDFPFNGEFTPHLENMYLKSQWTIDPLMEGYLRRQLDLCASRGIRVYWLIPPLAPSIQARREQLGLDAAYTRFTGRFQREYPGLVVLDSRRSGYDVPAFWDAAHLEFKGSVAFSREVGRALRSGQDAGQDRALWVNLPAYRDAPTAAPLEVMARSYQAIAESRVIRR